MAPKAILVDLHSGGVIIEFDDHSMLNYSNELLVEMISRAEIVPDVMANEAEDWNSVQISMISPN
jgi:hypothetical protein